MNKGKLREDPRGLLFEAYRIDGISLGECKSIFLDWVLGLSNGVDVNIAINAALIEYRRENPDHPMTAVLVDGLVVDNKIKRRRGGRAGRLKN